MGSSNRDYMQEQYETPRRSWGDDIPTTKWLLIITVVAFFLQTILTHDIVLPQREDSSVAQVDNVVKTVSRQVVQPVVRGGFGLYPSYLEEWFALDANKVLHGQVWRLLTYIFCHFRDSPFNLVMNMVALWYLGSVLERMYGSRELLWFYLVAGVVCGLIFVAFELKIDLPVPLMGSSSCVMALFCLYATHFPRQEILFCWIVPMQIRVLLLIFVALDLYTILNAYAGHTAWETVAYTSEIWGVAFGYLYRRNNWRLSDFGDVFDVRRLQRSIRRASTARNLKVFHPEPMTNLDEQVDAILAKIHEHGSESLTERERAILQKASEQAKNRL